MDARQGKGGRHDEAHTRIEERVVFPLIEESLSEAALTEWRPAWRSGRLVRVSSRGSLHRSSPTRRGRVPVTARAAATTRWLWLSSPAAERDHYARGHHCLPFYLHLMLVAREWGDATSLAALGDRAIGLRRDSEVGRGGVTSLTREVRRNPPLLVLPRPPQSCDDAHRRGS
jgi:hypothetical protein